MPLNTRSIHFANRPPLHAIAPAILAITLAACQTTGPTATPMRTVSAKWTTVQSQTDTMEVEAGKSTSRLALLRLTRALDAAYAAYHLTAPTPAIRIVSPHHPMVHHSTMAKAAVTASGDELIYFNRAHLGNSQEIESLVMHEVAHLKAWREHGYGIEPHGKEFKAICRTALPRRHCTPIL